MKNWKQIIAALLLLAMLLTMVGCGEAKETETAGASEVQESSETTPAASESESETVTASEAEDETSGESLEFSIREFKKHGNAILETTIEEFRENNIEAADIITVTVNGQSYDMPVGTSFSDVDPGSMLCRLDTEDMEVGLAINGGNFAETTGMATKEEIDEDPGYLWNISIDTVTITLKEKNGYRDEYTIRNLERSNEREDYSDLSDADFANCRLVAGCKDNTLYRGSSPLDPDLGRTDHVMAYLSENGIKAIINLADSPEEAEEYEGYADSYYASCEVYYAEMDYQFSSESFRQKVCDAIKFILEQDGPCFVHCKEGKDRTGIFCAILEGYLGASYEEVKDDYMQTFINYFWVEENDETYQKILNTNLVKVLCEIFEITDIETVDLQAEAEEYLLSAGLTSEELASLTEKLAA